jgi:hypothetical protein
VLDVGDDGTVGDDLVLTTPASGAVKERINTVTIKVKEL